MIETPEPAHRRWAKLTPDELELAKELARRAEQLRRRSNSGLSIAEAIDLAAFQMQTQQQAPKEDSE